MTQIYQKKTMCLFADDVNLPRHASAELNYATSLQLLTADSVVVYKLRTTGM